MLWLKRSRIVCVFCFVIGLFFFFSQTDLVLNPSHFANISNITYVLFTLILNSSGIYSQVSVGIWIQGEGGAACRSPCNFISKGLSPFCSFIHLRDIKILTYIISFKTADSFKTAFLMNNVTPGACHRAWWRLVVTLQGAGWWASLYCCEYLGGSDPLSYLDHINE